MSHLKYFLTILTTINCGLLPSTRPYVFKQSTIFIPKNLRNDINFISKLKVATPEFCRKQEIKIEAKYETLPWWYNYCRNVASLEDPIRRHQSILRQINEYKKKMILRSHRMMQISNYV